MSANEALSTPRVALLASPGAAREKLRLALQEAGADIVLEDDPCSLDEATLAGARPRAVLVALDAAIEDSLARFDRVLNDPAIAVIFDEAELAEKRQGWEAQRWIRHLTAKLHGHRNVLPPGHEEEVVLEPGLPVTPSQIHADASIAAHLKEAEGVALDLPNDDFGNFRAIDADEGDGLVDADAWLRSAAVDASEKAEAIQVPPPPKPLETKAAPETEALATPAPPTPSFDINSLSLVDLEPVTAERAPGAVVMLAGVGGPDAVRKVLSELPPDFLRPVLVCLRLDGGRYDNLVKQMARVSEMPVVLAEAGKPAEASHVYVLPDGVVGTVKDGGVDFVAGESLEGMIGNLSPKESAVLVLSGADLAHVAAASALAVRGAFVAGQSPQGCYDPAAVRALAETGAPLDSPAELARQLTERWV